MNKDPIHRNARQDYYHSNTNFPWRRVAGKGDQESTNYEEDNRQNDGDLQWEHKGIRHVIFLYHRRSWN